MGTNALIAGALGAAFLTVLLLQLNPHVPLVSGSTWSWFAAFGLLYGLHLAVAVYVLLVAREFFALDPFSPGWISVRVLAWIGASIAAGAAVLMWLNLDGLGLTLTAPAARRMRIGAAATSVSAVVLLGIAIAHYSFGRRGSRVGASLFALALVASLALPLAARGPRARGEGPPPVTDAELAAALPPVPGPRVTMILLDGASLDYIWPRAGEGRLPHLRRLLEEGASVSLATIRPTQANPVWASIATGMYPAGHGVRSAATYYALGDGRGVELLPDHCLAHVLTRVGLVREGAPSSARWRGRPLWSILARAGLTVGLVRWPLTHPAPDVPGFVVSDRYHELGASITGVMDAVRPRSVLARLPAPLHARDDASHAPAGWPAAADAAPESSALQRDGLYSAIMRALDEELAPRFAAVRFTGIDTIGHYYLQAAEPRTLAGGDDEAWRRQAQLIERYYGHVDDEIGAALGRMAEDDLLVVVSGFGMQPLNPVKRALGRLLSGVDYTGTHERAPDGFMIAFGSAVAAGGQPRGSIVDVAPTILYFLGLPVARDMDGYARTDIFTRAFTEQRPIAFVPSYGR